MDQTVMGGNMGAGPDTTGLAAGGAAETPTGENAPTTIFLSKDVLGGKTVKEGDRGSFVIVSVDPETGDAEASIEIGGSAPEAEEGYEAAFERAMPPERGA